MNPWWLLLIVPVSMYTGALIMSLLMMASMEVPRD